MKKALLCAAILALSTTVYAADDETTQDMSDTTHAAFVQLDTNHDGVIDAQEAKADPALAAVFEDVATDGKLDEADYTDWKSSDSE